VALRKRKYYDFSETNVKVDELMSHSPILKDEEYPEISYFENNRHKNYFQPEIHQVQNFCETPDPSRLPQAQFYPEQGNLGKQSLGNKNHLVYIPSQIHPNESFAPYNNFQPQVSQQHPSLQKQPIYYQNNDGTSAGAYFIKKENPRFESSNEYPKLYVYDIVPNNPYLIEQPSFQNMKNTQNYPIPRQQNFLKQEERPRNPERNLNNSNHNIQVIHPKLTRHYRY